jgi:Xaa-Pro aminopeptidase
MIAAAKTGARAGDVADAALARLPTNARTASLAYGLGCGCGLLREEAPWIEPGSDESLLEGAILTLRSVVPLGEDATIVTAMVVVASAGGTELEPL